MRCYRIVRPAYAASALSGEGARLYGGRWNPPGWRCVYAAESRALAVLELLVHLTGHSRRLSYRLLTLEIGETTPSETPALPPDWSAHPAGTSSQSIGLEWLKSTQTVAMRVPSVLIPEEYNLLLNPDAAGFEKIRVIEEREFRLDLRLSVDA
ncbi:RES family NAD+ phosphorylase [Haloferula chungangensis]|uniref:RES family NAD+ phosphorylase n=1 Tax=Haloferula chungangensis TaxID=1048331 RepID=A0ABW2L4Y4_9BACT